MNYYKMSVSDTKPQAGRRKTDEPDKDCAKAFAFWLRKEHVMPVPVAVRSKAWVYGRSPAEIVGSNPTGCVVR